MVICVCPPSLLAQGSKQPSGSRVAACSVLPKAEVKKHLPWHDMLDRWEPEEEPVGTNGSACEYPSVRIQILPPARYKDKPPVEEWERVSGVGAPAFFHNNRDRYAELWVNADKATVTLQASVPTGGTIASVKPKVVDLARAVIAKLP
jgi:hypothetical protein